LAAWDYADNVIRSLKDGLFVGRPDGTIDGVNAAACTLLGYDATSLVGTSVGAFFPADAAETLVRCAGEGAVSDQECTLRTKDGRDVPVLVSCGPLQNHDGVTVGFVAIAKDITERKVAEEQVRRSLREKEVLLREVHHRVKNNLQVVSSLLKLQSRKIDDDKSRELLQESQSRIWSMSLVHERLYQSADLVNVDVPGYVRTLVGGLCQTFMPDRPQDVRVRQDVCSAALEIDTMIPCGLIINELVTNALKYAFPAGRGGTIDVLLQRRADGRLELSVADDGVGLPPSLDYTTSESLGLRLVTMLAEDQLDGELSIHRDGGTRVVVRFAERSEDGH